MNFNRQFYEQSQSNSGMNVQGSNKQFQIHRFQLKLKTGLSRVGKCYGVNAVLTNAHTCLYKNNVLQYFDIDPPLLKEYLQ